MCKDGASERSTCPSDDESVSAPERRSLWGDSDSETEGESPSAACLPPGVWQGGRVSTSQRRRTNKSRTGTETLMVKSLPCDFRTTIVLRKLPTIWLREDLIGFLASHGFHGRFDFAYLPINFKKGQAFGFALVNFLAMVDAEQALAALNGLMLERQPVLAERSESIQGTEALVEKYRNNAVMHDDVGESHKPLLLSQGRVVPFPKPTARVQPPAEQMQAPSKAEPSMFELASSTTLIIRKLGRSCSLEQFMTLLNCAGFAAKYDFVYVPRHFSKGSSFGYGIVNFVDNAFALEALSKIAAGALSVNGTTVTAEWSDTMQGLSALIEKYRSSKVMKKGMPASFKPVVLSNGIPICCQNID